jgi:YhcH/YjgK/YiaL family protein
MIIDRFENLDLYFDRESRIYEAVCFARDFDLSRSDGKYKVDGDNVFAECKTYFTKPVEERSFESHVKHIDVQVMLEGQEMMGHTLDNVPSSAYGKLYTEGQTKSFIWGQTSGLGLKGQ